LLELFSLKEAVYKALHPHVPRYIGFEECEIAADGSITMFLVGGEGPFVLRGMSRWEGQRLISIASAARVQ
jgi:4'-phosphopantetheinyl transferase EntD